MTATTVKPGELDRRIEIQVKTSTQNSAGEVVETWVTLMKVWAKRRDWRTDERFGAASQRVAEIITLFTVRWFPGLDFMPDTYRILFEGRLYDITGITEIGRRLGYEITAFARAEASFSDN